MWLIGSLIVTLIALQAITFWREHGVWEPVRQPVEALYWVLWGFYLVVFVSIVLNGVKLGKQFLPFAARFSYFWAKTRLTRMKIVRLKIRLWRGERRVKKNERTIEQLQQRASNVEEQFEIRVAYTDYLLAFYDKRKDELIATHGEEKWAELRAGLLAQKKKAEEIRAEVQSIKARHDLDEDWSLLDEQTSLDDDRARELDEKP
jgi:hypothetical protein